MSTQARLTPSATSFASLLIMLGLMGLPACGGGGEDGDQTSELSGGNNQGGSGRGEDDGGNGGGGDDGGGGDSGGEDDGGGDGGGDGDGDGGGDGGGSGSDGDGAEPPPDTGDMEGFGVWPGSGPQSAPGSRLTGFVGYRNSPRIAQMTTDGTVEGGLYRRTWFVNEEDVGQNFGEDFLMAEEHGHRAWFTVVGTPADLSPHPELTDNEFNTGLPQYARYAPTDPVAWADRVLAQIDRMESLHGMVPDCVEIWNEVERPEWFTGTLEEFLGFFAPAAQRIRAARPDILVGGPGLAGYGSRMGGTESVLLALIRHTAATGAPLDFVSWHHYGPGAEILFSDMPNEARALAASLGRPQLRAIVSEWNISPGAQGAMGLDFDGPHAAANYANFFATAYVRNLDGNMYFMDVDEDNDGGIVDLAGVSLGSLTLHGIKKPVFRVAEILHDMIEESIVRVYEPELDEFSLRVFASRSGDRTRIVVSNDVVSGSWVFANRARQHGMEPGWLADAYDAAGGSQATVEDLVAVGLTEEQAIALLDFMPEVYRASRYSEEPRPTVVTVLGLEDFTPVQVLRFDEAHNAPAHQLAGLMPELEQVEQDAAWAAAVATSDYLASEGYTQPPEDILTVPDALFHDWAASEGIPFGYSVVALKLRRDTLRDERFAQELFLNSQPETLLQVEAPAAAGIVVDGRKLRFTMDPDSVYVIDLVH